MGLDMFLYSFPNNGMSPKDISVVRSELRNFVSRDGIFNTNGVTSNWLTRIGIKPSDIPAATTMISTAKVSYDDWDKEKDWPHFDFMKEEAYWRKANAIHSFFVTHDQGGEDDCTYHDPIEKETLEDLLGRCERVLSTVKDADGKPVTSKTIIDNNPWEHTYTLNRHVAEKELETMGGFFFGSTDYEQAYLYNVAYTAEVVTKLLHEFDWKNRRLFYVSSW